MPAYHDMAELGPRDMVSRAIMEQMKKYPGPVYLDITHRDADFLRQRFPTVYTLSLQAGFDLAGAWLPVSPAAHYAMGGVWTGLSGETSLRGLYACGEVACTGVHGANRLASNSLLECLVFAARSVRRIEQEGIDFTLPVKTMRETSLLTQRPARVASLRHRLRGMMFEEAGILRQQDGRRVFAGTHVIISSPEIKPGDVRIVIAEAQHLAHPPRLTSRGVGKFLHRRPVVGGIHGGVVAFADDGLLA